MELPGTSDLGVFTEVNALMELVIVRTAPWVSAQRNEGGVDFGSHSETQMPTPPRKDYHNDADLKTASDNKTSKVVLALVK